MPSPPAQPRWGDARYYAGHSAPQRAGGSGALPRLARATRDWLATGPPAPPVVIADYGCAGGSNSLDPVRLVVDEVRGAGYGGPVVVAHVDLPSNDFGALFHALADDPGSYRAPDIFPVAIGRSFYEPVLPGGSVAIGWSSHAAHWLRRKPEGTDLDGHVFVHMAPVAAREVWAAVAADDWHRFLAARAAELRPGGRLVVELSAADQQGMAGSEPLYAVVDRALAHLARQGLLPASRLVTMAVPVYSRTEAELTAPFAGTDPGGLLSLESLQLRPIPDPFLDDLHRTGDAATYAARWATTVRAFTEDLFFANLAADLADTFYDTVARLIEEDPEAVTNDWLVADLVVARR